MTILIALAVGFAVAVFGSEYDTARKEEVLRTQPFVSAAPGFPIQCQPQLSNPLIRQEEKNDRQWQ